MRQPLEWVKAIALAVAMAYMLLLTYVVIEQTIDNERLKALVIEQELKLRKDRN